MAAFLDFLKIFNGPSKQIDAVDAIEREGVECVVSHVKQKF